MNRRAMVRGHDARRLEHPAPWPDSHDVPDLRRSPEPPANDAGEPARPAQRRDAAFAQGAVGIAGLTSEASAPAVQPDAPRRARRGLDWFSFFIANLQTGFGPFVSVYLTSEKWTQSDIGFVLTIGGFVGLLAQVPAGALVDAVRSKRAVAAIAVAAVGASALGLAGSSFFPIILLAWVAHALASSILSPALASLSLGLVGHGGLGRRLGRNASFASIGSAVAAAGMGAIGHYLTHQAVFMVTAALMVPALFALLGMGREPVRSEAPSPQAASPAAAQSSAPAASWREALLQRPLLIFAACIVLFHLANAAMLPLLAGAVTVRSSASASILIAACIIVPQAAVAVLSPWVGSLADSWGRRPLLLIGFTALPIRGILFGITQDPELLVAVQVLDGISAAALGVLVPLVVADLTRDVGNYALAQGVIGTAVGIGAALSTLLGGLMADRLGTKTAFIGLAILAALAVAIVSAFMPETGKACDKALGAADPRSSGG